VSFAGPERYFWSDWTGRRRGGIERLELFAPAEASCRLRVMGRSYLDVHEILIVR
jgi:hypothetical protein